MIYRRKSVRSFTGEPVDQETIDRIKAFGAELKPLYPEINYRWDIVSRDAVKCFLPWTTPQLIAVYSEEVLEEMLDAFDTEEGTKIQFSIIESRDTLFSVENYLNHDGRFEYKTFSYGGVTEYMIYK